MLLCVPPPHALAVAPCLPSCELILICLAFVGERESCARLGLQFTREHVARLPMPAASEQQHSPASTISLSHEGLWDRFRKACCPAKTRGCLAHSLEESMCVCTWCDWLFTSVQKALPSMSDKEYHHMIGTAEYRGETHTREAIPPLKPHEARQTDKDVLSCLAIISVTPSDLHAQTWFHKSSQEGMAAMPKPSQHCEDGV